jgi:hypothetical protein
VNRAFAPSLEADSSPLFRGDVKGGARAVAQWVGHLVLAPEVEAEAAVEVGAQGATAEQVGGAATLAGDPPLPAPTSGLGGAGPG